MSDLVITKPWTSVSSELLRAAAKVADGVPALTWRVVELGFRLESGNPEQDAFVGWQKLRYLSDPSSGRQWDQLRRLHRHALEVVAALSFDLPPFTIPAAGKTVSDALKRLSEVGVAWQPRSREWAIADPLLAAWARDHVPLWVRQRDARRRG
ncbi:MAG TPA: hypothetical protein VGO31_10410 [Microbacteriaceae bacterium]|nr:hypothetical protein [Microbacteriaceae bacterium]